MIRRILLSALLLGVGALETRKCGSWGMKKKWHCQLLASNLAVYWKVLGSTSTIKIAVDAASTADMPDGLKWVGLGLSEGSGMPGSDIFLLRKSAQDTPSWTLTDMYATAFAQPEVDDSQDLKLISFSETGGGTGVRATFSRPLHACEPHDRSIEPGVKQELIFAFSGERWSGAGHSLSNRGSFVIALWPDAPGASASSANSSATPSATPSATSQKSKKNNSAAAAAAAQGMLTAEFVMPAVQLPTDPDLYLCVDVEMPSDMAYHLVEYEGVRQLTGTPSTYNHVHHMVLYACNTKPTTFGKGPYECPGMPMECLEFSLVWAPGGGSVTFPPNAGIRMGVGGIQYAALQLHYSNVPGIEGVIDSSGFKISYTPNLRPEDVGVMVLGHVMFRIPPLAQDWTMGPSVCPKECTGRFKQNITLISAALHMHQTGTNITTQHFRGGKEMRPLSTQSYYNFRYQAISEIPVETHQLMPGDTLVTKCFYSNPNNKTVYFGEQTSNEMCFAFLWYYPKAATGGIDACVTIGDKSLASLAICSKAGLLVDALTKENVDYPSTLAGLLKTGAVIAGAPMPGNYTPYNKYARCPPTKS